MGGLLYLVLKVPDTGFSNLSWKQRHYEAREKSAWSSESASDDPQLLQHFIGLAVVL